MKKRLLSLALAATMLFGASMTVSAETSTVSNGNLNKEGNVNYTGDVKEVTIKVTVSTAGNTVTVNPYCLLINDVSDSLTVSDISFNNESNVPVKVSVKGSVGVSDNSKVTFYGDPAQKRPTEMTADRQALVYVDFVNVSDNSLMTSVYNVKKQQTIYTPVSPTALATGSLKLLDNCPVLSVSSNDADYVSSMTTLKIKGWTIASSTAGWSKAAAFKVNLVYNIIPMNLGDESLFGDTKALNAASTATP